MSSADGGNIEIDIGQKWHMTLDVGLCGRDGKDGQSAGELGEDGGEDGRQYYA
jgi:hypothetical protein